MQLTILPFGTTVECSAEKTLLDTILDAGVRIASICGGNGRCGRCVVELIEGELAPAGSTPPPKPDELSGEQKRFYACTVIPKSDCTVFIPESSLDDKLQSQTEYRSQREESTAAAPLVALFRLKLPLPTLSDSRSDTDRIIDAVRSEYGISIERVDGRLLTNISTVLRENNWSIAAAIYNGELIFAGPPEGRRGMIAVDVE